MHPILYVLGFLVLCGLACPEDILHHPRRRARRVLAPQTSPAHFVITRFPFTRVIRSYNFPIALLFETSIDQLTRWMDGKEYRSACKLSICEPCCWAVNG